MTKLAGFIGAGLAGAAYVPQLWHMIRARCAQGISRLAFVVWLVASILVMVDAVATGATVFICLGMVQIVATTLVLIYSIRYAGSSCAGPHPHVGTSTVRANALFVLIGADPHTEWLEDAVARDQWGYVLTGNDVRSDGGTRPVRQMETSMPGVFAVGDVRHGAVKRVASGVGEGSASIGFVHDFLASADSDGTALPSDPPGNEVPVMWPRDRVLRAHA